MLIFIAAFVLIPFCQIYAEDYTADPFQTPASAYDEGERKQRMALMLDYARKQSPHWVQGLLDNIHDPGHWAENELGLNDENENDGGTQALTGERDSSLLHYNWAQFDAKPVFGQNLLHPQGYLGGKVTANLGASPDRPKPWGTVSLRYIDDNSASGDGGHGFDMSGVVNFDEHLSLNAGVREDTSIGSGDYLMLRWKLVEGP